VFHAFIIYLGIFSDDRPASILNPYRPPITLLVAIIAPICWLREQSYRFRYVWRYMLRVARRFRIHREINIDTPLQYLPSDKRITIQNPKLHNILCVEHVLKEVVYWLHYEDVINLSMASKSVREAVFPSGDLIFRIPKLRRWTCDPDTKSVCLYCNKGICMVSDS
jgi:hypothetical protein